MIRFDNIEKSFGQQVILQKSSFHFPENGRIALFGANGAGKTTLLRIIAGLEEPDSGTVLRPASVKLGYLRQHPNPDPLPTLIEEVQSGHEEICRLGQRLRELENSHDAAQAANLAEAEAAFRAAGGYSLPARASAILSGLGFTQSDLSRNPRNFSGGQRMRIELAKLLLSDPDFLILDEPTNHLDLPSLAWVEGYLQQFRGIILFVTHDRTLINRLANSVLHLHHGQLDLYKGNFESFLAQRALRLEQEAAALANLQKKREHLQSFVDRFGAKASKASQAQSRVKMIERLAEAESEFTNHDHATSVPDIRLPDPPKCGRIVLKIEDGTIGYSSDLASRINLLVERGQKIAIIGANGLGKTTLLKTIAGFLPARHGSFQLSPDVLLAYHAQSQMEVLDPEATVLENVLRQTGLPNKEARSLLGGLLFSGDTIEKRAAVLSGGELNRLGLACMLGKKANFLLLDEPTNHLDMTSTEVLAEALADYQGTILFVSHDRSFIDAVCTHVFVVTGSGQSQLFAGKLEDYTRMCRASGFPDVLSYSNQPAQGQGQSNAGRTESTGNPLPADHEAQVRDLKKQRNKLTSEIATLERSMESLKQQCSTMEKDLATVDASDHGRLAELHAALAAKVTALDEAETAWLEKSTAVEEIAAELNRLGRR